MTIWHNCRSSYRSKVDGSDFLKAFKEYGISVPLAREYTKGEKHEENSKAGDQDKTEDDFVSSNLHIEADCAEE
ncbi:hypothetical protein Hamer_G018837 [Homarus americanus]|uniref:Uncharacterized protein n=1 Tax=Homarus americanus TaxID=6706 RepID=A0A8J5MNB0_HOMAM|nr:hypothetical protein Hamer_G018837 [Homarus americanus]